MPMYAIQARYRWDMTEAYSPPSPVNSPMSDAFWGGYDGDPLGSRWLADDGVGAGFAGAYQGKQLVFGATGMGPEIALAIRGSANARMTLIGVDIAFDEGGIL